jgi:hypothetical protein
MRIVALIVGIMLVSASVVGAIDTPSRTVPPAMPEVQDGVPYTGVIQNKTSFEVSIPSDNSDAALIIPPHGWIEYTIWTHRFDVAAYQNGDPFYCLKLIANPQAYTFKCKKYDFMAEIVKAEPVKRNGPSKLKHRKIKRKVKNPPC